MTSWPVTWFSRQVEAGEIEPDLLGLVAETIAWDYPRYPQSVQVDLLAALGRYWSGYGDGGNADAGQ